MGKDAREIDNVESTEVEVVSVNPVFQMELVEVNEKGMLEIDEMIRKTAINVKDSELDGATFVKGGQFVEGRGRDVDMVPAKWLPEPIKPFCEHPSQVPVPQSIGPVKLFRPLDMEKIRNHDPEGQALIIFVSSKKQAWGPPTEKPYMIGLEPTKNQASTLPMQSFDRKVSDMIREVS